MGMYGSTQFNRSKGAKTPDFLGAELGQGQANAAEQARINALRSTNQSMGAGAYNLGMGDATPIGDAVEGALGIGEAAPVGDAALSAQATTQVDALVGGSANSAELAGALRGGADVAGAAEAGAAIETGAVAAETGAIAAETGAVAAEVGAGSAMGAVGTVLPWVGLAALAMSYM